MERTLEACAESISDELSNADGSWFRICAQVLEAIPADTPYGEVGSRIRRLARLVGKSEKTVERWRDTALDWSSVMRFPPQGGLAKVDYTVYRDLPSAFKHDVVAAAAFLQEVVSANPSASRFSRPTVFAELPEEIKESLKAKREAAQAARRDTARSNAGGTGESREVTPLDQPLVEELKRQTTPSAAVRIHLEAAQQTLVALDDETRAIYKTVENAIKKAITALSKVEDPQLAIEA